MKIAEMTSLTVTCGLKRRYFTLLFSHCPHHEVHTGSVGLAAQFERAQFTLEVLNIMQDPLQLRLAAAELLQHKVMNLLHIVCL